MDGNARWAVGHIGLNVTDLDRSTTFYRTVLGLEVRGESHANGREFVFLGHGDETVLTLWRQASGGFSPSLAGLHHLAFRAESIEEVRRAEERVRAAGAAVLHEGIVPHAEGEDSGGIFFEDPDGVRIEIFADRGAGDRPAPVSDAPTCGFF